VKHIGPQPPTPRSRYPQFCRAQVPQGRAIEMWVERKQQKREQESRACVSMPMWHASAATCAYLREAPTSGYWVSEGNSTTLGKRSSSSFQRA
jgi:hypothetical protein